MPPNPIVNAEKSTLLVVDDNEMNRDMLGRRLEKKGYAVRTAADGASALELVEKEAIDLILLDIEMPGLSGMDVLRTLRKTYTTIELPIIMATARSESQDVVEALEAGANDYVTKPLDFPVVLARVEAQLRTRRKAAARPEPATEPADEDVGPGKVLASKYRLEARIGAGAFGTVYRAKHIDLHHLVAVKVLHTSAARTPDTVARFKREGVAACRIKHPNAVSVLDFGTTRGGAAFLVMELLEGIGLDEELASAGRLPQLRCAEIIRSVCDALAEAHRAGIVHRDIKPANVFLHRAFQGEVVKVLDFGIAKLLDDDARGRNLTVEGGIIGTPAYMAPERFRGTTPSGAADVYSVGVMMFQMLTGRLPFVAPDSDLVAMAMLHINGVLPPLAAFVPDLSPAVERVVVWALAKQEAARPTAAQLSDVLSHALGLSTLERSGLSGSRAPASRAGRAPRPSPAPPPEASPEDPTVLVDSAIRHARIPSSSSTPKEGEGSEREPKEGEESRKRD